MSGGTFNQGTAAKIRVGPSDPPTIELEGVQSATLDGARSTTEDAFYMEASDTSVGPIAWKWNISGKCKSGAPGLILLEAALDDNLGTPIWISGSLEGTKGRSVQCRVATGQVGFPDVKGKCAYTFTAEYAGANTSLAGGSLFS